jgi:hypothetical protein
VHKSAGYDSFLYKVIKSVIKAIASNCHLSIQVGSFSDKTKLANLVFKVEDKCEISDYRPISELPKFSDILEKYFITGSFYF